MKRLTSLCFLLAFTLLASCSSQDAKIEFDSILIDEKPRAYRIVIPDHTTKRGRIVLAFHGTGDTAESMAEYSRLDEMAVKNGFVIVYPEAENGMWKSVNLTTENASENPDVVFFDVLTDTLRQKLLLPNAEFDLIGMSNGGEFALALGRLRSNYVNSIVAHSAGFPTSLDTPEPQIPTLFVIGENDVGRLALENETKHWQEKGHSVKLSVVPGLGHEWSRKNNGEISNFINAH